MLPLVYQKMNHDAQSMLCAICKIHIGIKVVFCFRHAALFIIIMGICSLASNTHDEAFVNACLVYSVESVYIYNSSYYHRQIGSIILSHLWHIFRGCVPEVVVPSCAVDFIYIYIHIHIYINNWLHYGPMVIFALTHYITSLSSLCRPIWWYSIQAPLSPSNWCALHRGRAPAMSWILLKANNGLQTSGWAIKDFSVLSEMCSICEQPLHGIILMILHTNKWCLLISDKKFQIFFESIWKFPALRDTRTALSLPVEHARHDTMEPHWARTCWMVMGQWLEPQRIPYMASVTQHLLACGEQVIKIWSTSLHCADA